MKIELNQVTVRELFEVYEADGHDGVVSFAGKLGRFYVNGNRKYARIVICRKKAEQ